MSTIGKDSLTVIFSEEECGELEAASLCTLAVDKVVEFFIDECYARSFVVDTPSAAEETLLSEIELDILNDVLQARRDDIRVNLGYPPESI